MAAVSRPGWLPLVPVLAMAALIYFHSFGTVPLYLGGDEAHSGIQAHSLATTGRDLTGRAFPLFVNVENPLPGMQGANRWWQPFLIYVQAAALAFLPLAEWSVRLPSAVMALVNIALVYGIATRLVSHALYPALAALLLALTPTHLIFGRQALDYFSPVTFVLAWLWCLVTVLDTGKPRWALAAGLVLGVGSYTHVGAWAFMPMCLLLTLVAVVRSKWPLLRPAAAVCIGFAVPVAFLLPWILSEPQMMSELLGSYQVVGTSQLTFLQNVRDKLNYNNIQDKIDIYWDYFNPSFLFFTGGVNLTHATRSAGVFLMPVSVLLVLGIYDLVRRASTSVVSIILLAGFVLAPIPATLRGEGAAIQRDLVMLPFAVLIATYGVAFMRAQPRPIVRAAAVVLLAALPFQYAYFARDYFGDYQTRAAYWFDNVNFRDVAGHMLARDAAGRVPAIYLSNDLDDGAARWLFYLIKHRREDLWQRTREFDPTHLDVAQVPPGSLLVLYSNDPRVATLVGPGKCAIDTSVMHAGVRPRPSSCERPRDGCAAKIDQEPAPTTNTAHPLVDAFLWIKHPGESDGTCGGGPPAGQWWAAYALELSRLAATLSGVA